MCSCDYFVPINYRCVAAEKDDCSWSIPRSLREIVLENSTSFRTGVNRIPSKLTRKVSSTDAIDMFPTRKFST
jgi:hypothetical protein